MLSSISVALMSDNSRKRGSAGNSHSPGVDSMTVMGFPRMSSTPDEMCAVELDFPRASFPPGKSCAEERVYIRQAWLDGSPVCAWTVAGSLLIGSPHRRVWGCFHSTLLFLLRFDGLDVVRWSINVQHAHLLVTIVSRFTPDISTSVWIVSGSGSSFCGACVIACWERFPLGHDRSEFCQCRQYLVPPGNLAWIVLVVFYISYRVVTESFMASSRSSEMDQAGPSSASSAPLPGTFLGLALGMRSDRLYDLASDIPDVMGLWALRPSAAIVKVMSVPDSRCIWVVTPDDHVNIGFHEVLLHDMEDEDFPFVALSELGCLRLVWPKLCLCLCLVTSMIWNGCGRNAKNASVARSRGTVLIVESIFSRIWASTLPCITWS